MAEAQAASITVEVVYALPEVQPSVLLSVAPGTTLAEAVARSGLAAEYPEIPDLPAGIRGKRVAGDTPLADGDRVEIYRPLRVDPKQARRLRARAAPRRP